MPLLPPDDLDRAYRDALRREVQLRQMVQERDEIILRLKGKFLANVQEIDFEVVRLNRRERRIHRGHHHVTEAHEG